MNVAELIAALEQHDPRAIVVLWDHDARPGPGVSQLREGDVRPLQLTGWESNGVLLLEPSDGSKEDGPMPGIVLGSL
jgi:hypothetical protein